MKTRPLGSNGPEISVVGFGAWEAGGSGWGEAPPDEQTIAAMHAGFDAGMTWIDTAEVYGRGKSEKLVGRALKGRDDILIFTKLAPKPSGSGFRAAEVRKGAEASLRRLGRDVIDLYQLHWSDPSVPIEETWEAMARLVEEGLVRHIGVSNFRIDLLERCEALRHVDCLQSQYSMLVRKLEKEVFPWCAQNGTGVLCYGPLAYGLLTGAISAETNFDDNDWRSGKLSYGYYDKLFAPGIIEENLALVDRLKPIAARLGVTLAQLALAWTFAQEWCTAAIAGSRSAEHTRDNAAAGDLVLDRETLREFDELLTR